MAFLDAVWRALSTGAGLFWKAFWALALGYAISAIIQVFLSREEAARHLGRARPKEVGLAMGLGFASSSCSFAALSATRSLFAKGADLVSALAFMFASTNLAIEVAVLAWIFLGWQFVVALFLGAFPLVAVMWLIVRLTVRRRWVEDARSTARETGGHEMDSSARTRGALRERIRDATAWTLVGTRFLGEWGMVWRELLIGFAAAGAIAALVPESFFKALFPEDLPAVILVPLHVLLAPVLALLTFIGSMGNGPLAAVLWQHGVAFGAIMAFLYSDFIVPPSLRINARYYGWRFAVYLGVVFAGAAVVAGIAIHVLFAAVGLIPEVRRDVQELATFRIDYTFFLNVFALVVSTVLVVLSRRSRSEREERRHATA